MRRKMIVGAWVAAGLATGLAAAGFQLYQPILPHANAAATAQAAAPAAQPAVRGLPDFSPLVERYGPAVVNINVTQAQKAGTAGPQLRGLDPDDPFYEFFRRF